MYRKTFAKATFLVSGNLLNLLARVKPATGVSKIVKSNRQLSRLGTGKAPFG